MPGKRVTGTNVTDQSCAKGGPRGVRTLAAQAERMTRGVGEDARVVGVRLMAQLRRAQRQGGALGHVEIVDPQTQMELHG